MHATTTLRPSLLPFPAHTHAHARTSSEWKLMTARRPPGDRAEMASGSAYREGRACMSMASIQ